MPEHATHVAQDILSKLHTGLNEHLSDGSSKGWSANKLAIYSKIFSALFPVTDFLHPVLTPNLLLIGLYLSHQPIINVKDLVQGLFICTVAITIIAPAKRIMPEVLNYIYLTFNNLIGKEVPLSLLMKINLKFQLKDLSAIEPSNFNYSLLHITDFSELVTDQFRINTLYTCINLLLEQSKLYGSSISYPDVFTRFIHVLKLFHEYTLPKKLKDLLNTVEDNITKTIIQLEKTRRPLNYFTAAPIAIKQFNPKFDEHFSINKLNDPDKERAELKKLTRKVKHETKGAMRELRKDAEFLSKEKDRKRRLETAERDTRTKEIMTFLSNQQHDLKQLTAQKKKTKEKLIKQY